MTRSTMNLWRQLLSYFARPTKASSKVDTRYQRLLQLQKRHSFIDVAFVRTGKTYRSMILSLHADDGHLLIDDLSPREGTQNLLEGDIAEIKSTSKDLAVSFQTRYLARRFEDGSPIFVMELPEDLSVSHNRQAYRISVFGETGLTISMHDHDGNPVDGQIINMSTEGLKLNIEGDWVSALQQHPLLEDCLIQLPNDVDIECHIEIINAYFIRSPHEHTLAGGKLVIPNPQQQVKLGQYLAGVQRKQLRREMR